MRYRLKNPPTVDAAEVRHVLDAAKVSLGNLPNWVEHLYDQGRVEFGTETAFVHIGDSAGDGLVVREAELGEMIVLTDDGYLFVTPIDEFDVTYEPIEG